MAILSPRAARGFRFATIIRKEFPAHALETLCTRIRLAVHSRSAKYKSPAPCAARRRDRVSCTTRERRDKQDNVKRFINARRRGNAFVVFMRNIAERTAPCSFFFVSCRIRESSSSMTHTKQRCFFFGSRGYRMDFISVMKVDKEGKGCERSTIGSFRPAAFAGDAQLSLSIFWLAPYSGSFLLSCRHEALKSSSMTALVTDSGSLSFTERSYGENEKNEKIRFFHSVFIAFTVVV